jgi:hypothetical protein
VSETWYRKVGRRYIPVAEAEAYRCEVHEDGFVLTYRKDGMTRYEYSVTPDVAGFRAAAILARVAMEDALSNAATNNPMPPLIPFNKKQMKLIEQFKKDMGMAYPRWWQPGTSREISQAGIDAVIESIKK